MCNIITTRVTKLLPSNEIHMRWGLELTLIEVSSRKYLNNFRLVVIYSLTSFLAFGQSVRWFLVVCLTSEWLKESQLSVQVQEHKLQLLPMKAQA